jgi:hypothetical protein
MWKLIHADTAYFLFLIPVLHNQPQQSFWKQFPLAQIQKIQFSLQHPNLKQKISFKIK